MTNKSARTSRLFFLVVFAGLCFSFIVWPRGVLSQSSPLDSTTEFVKQQYRDFLNREAEPGGLQFWANQIDSGATTKVQVIDFFLHSEEFEGRIAPIVRLYFAYFLRIPDYEGLQFWINQYTNGTPLASISELFASSPEFQQRYGSLNNEQFVTLIYQNVLGRNPDADGNAYWVGELSSETQTRGQVMLGFSESQEYKSLMGNDVLVTMMYVGMLRRSPEQGGFDYWVWYLDSGNSGLALIDGFLNSQEYTNRFKPDLYNVTLTINVDPLGAGTVAIGTTPYSSSVTVASGTLLTLSASPASGYTFTQWTENGSVLSSSSPYGITMNGNRTITAKFMASTNPPPSTGEPLDWGKYYDGIQVNAGTTRTFAFTLNTTGMTGVHVESIGRTTSSYAEATFTIPSPVDKSFTQPIIGWDMGLVLTLYAGGAIPTTTLPTGTYLLRITATKNTIVRIICNFY